MSDANEETGRAAFFGISNFRLLDLAGNYLSPTTEFNPYTHTWSLGVEEQFYLLFPLLMFAWVRGRRRLSLGLVAATSLASLAFVAAVSRSQPSVAFYMLSCRFWELGAGALLFQAYSSRERPLVGGTVATVGSAVAVALLVAAFALGRERHSPFPDGLLAVAGTGGLLALVPGTGARNAFRRLLESRPAVAVGLISYSLYLWYWPVFVLFRWTVGLESAATRVSAVALTASAAVASYFLVERPFRYGALVARMPRPAIVATALAAVFASSQAYAQITSHRARLSRSIVSADVLEWYPEASGGARACLPPGRRPDLAGGAVTVYSSTACRRPGESRVFVTGDSHALAYAPMLRSVAARSRRDIVLYYKPGCAIFSLRPARAEPARCRGFAAATVADIARRASRGDVLFLPSLRLPRLSDQWYVRTAPPAAITSPELLAARAAAADRAASALEPLVQRGIRVVFEAPPPVFRAPAFRCVDWFNRHNPICRGGLTIERALIERYRAPVLGAYERVRARLPGVIVWDPLPALCPGAICHAVSGRHPLFFDGDHISAYGNRVVQPSFERVLSAPGPQDRARASAAVTSGR